MALFKGLCYLKKINLKDNGLLKSIHKDTLNGLFNLEDLNLSSNHITFLDSSLFRGLVCLSRIDLSNNQLDFIPLEAFNRLKNLKEINLSSNWLESIDKDVFKGLNELKIVKLLQKNEQCPEIHLELSVNYVSFQNDIESNGILLFRSSHLTATAAAVNRQPVADAASTYHGTKDFVQFGLRVVVLVNDFIRFLFQLY